jgi:hypothetical protein
MVGQLTQRLGRFLVFPKIANLKGSTRRWRAGPADPAPHAGAGGARDGVALAASDAFILLFYDSRYHEAAFMLPVLLFGAWFGVAGDLCRGLLLGCDRPAPGAFANAGKFAVLATGLPLAIAFASLFAGLLILAVAEFTRWLVLSRALVREKLAFVGDDLALTAVMLATAFFVKLALGAVGLVPDLADWWAMGAGIMADSVARIGAVCIGPQRGRPAAALPRLARGLPGRLVYVDSASTDGSVAAAREAGRRGGHARHGRPFTAARARAEGFARLEALAPALEYVMFRRSAIARSRPAGSKPATAFPREQPDFAVACGRRRERSPEASRYNALADRDGTPRPARRHRAEAMRSCAPAALREVGGSDPAMIAGEEPELCRRLRGAGGGSCACP